MRNLVLSVTFSVVAATAAAAALLSSHAESPPPWSAEPQLAPPLAATARLVLPARPRSEPRHAPRVVGTVVDAMGRPVAGVRIATAEMHAAVVSGHDGSFDAPTTAGGACCVLPAAGWLPVESPLLDLVHLVATPTLVVAPAAQLAGRVLDEAGVAIVGARVTIELRVELRGRAAVERFAPDVFISNWAAATDVDGWYSLPMAPIGPNATLSVECVGCAPARTSLAAIRLYQHVTLTRLRPVAAEAAAPDVAGEPARLVAAGSLDGWLGDEHGRPRAGWWAAAVPLGDADEVHGHWGRYAAPPVRTGVDGRFSFSGLPGGRYCVEAWRPDNRAVARSPEFSAPVEGLQLAAPELVLPARVRGRVVDTNGRPVVGARVGLARPTGWAVPVPLAMQAVVMVTTDGGGGFDLPTCGRAALELCIDGAGIVPLRSPLDVTSSPAANQVVARARRWLAGAARARLHREVARLQVLAADGAPLPIWREGVAASTTAIDPSAVGSFGFPADARRIVLWVGTHLAGRLDLLP